MNGEDIYHINSVSNAIMAFGITPVGWRHVGIERPKRLSLSQTPSKYIAEYDGKVFAKIQFFNSGRIFYLSCT